MVTVASAIRTEWVQELIFLGTGTSGCVPSMHCITTDNPTCHVCMDALTPNSKNRRRNTSLLIRTKSKESGELKNIVIDCGKTFYEGAVQWFVTHKLRRIDALILTHGHADAILGLDDLRHWTLKGLIQNHVDVFLSTATMETVKSVFPYLVDERKASGGGDVSHLSFHIIDANGIFSPFDVCGFCFIPIEVEHGYHGNNLYISLGFRFDTITYISDVVKIPEKSRPLIVGSQVLILDALRYEKHLSHFSVSQSLQEILNFAPRLGFFTGCSHTIDHEKLASKLDEWRNREIMILTGRAQKFQLVRSGEDEWQIRQWNVINGFREDGYPPKEEAVGEVKILNNESTDTNPETEERVAMISLKSRDTSAYDPPSGIISDVRSEYAKTDPHVKGCADSSYSDQPTATRIPEAHCNSVPIPLSSRSFLQLSNGDIPDDILNYVQHTEKLSLEEAEKCVPFVATAYDGMRLVFDCP